MSSQEGTLGEDGKSLLLQFRNRKLRPTGGKNLP